MDRGHFDALIAAINRHDAEDVRRLIDAGAPFQQRNRLGVTPLIIACGTGDGVIAKVLVEAGADINATGPDGATALMHAGRVGSLEMVTLLLNRGAAVDTRDPHQRTALFYATEFPAKPEIMRVLIEAGADAAARDADGKAPLDLVHVPFSQRGAVRALRLASNRK